MEYICLTTAHIVYLFANQSGHCTIIYQTRLQKTFTNWDNETPVVQLSWCWPKKIIIIIKNEPRVVDMNYEINWMVLATVILHHQYYMEHPWRQSKLTDSRAEGFILFILFFTVMYLVRFLPHILLPASWHQDYLQGSPNSQKWIALSLLFWTHPPLMSF